MTTGPNILASVLKGISVSGGLSYPQGTARVGDDVDSGDNEHSDCMAIHYGSSGRARFL